MHSPESPDRAGFRDCVYKKEIHHKLEAESLLVSHFGQDHTTYWWILIYGDLWCPDVLIPNLQVFKQGSTERAVMP